jgi:hypothetical protein
MKLNLVCVMLMSVFISSYSLSMNFIHADLLPIGPGEPGEPGEVCDGKGASGSVGACKSGVKTCSSATQESLCDPFMNGDEVAVKVIDDFPTSCPNLANHNCNEPLADCWGAVSCIWSNGKCGPKGDPTVWTKEKKRKSVACTSN